MKHYTIVVFILFAALITACEKERNYTPSESIDTDLNELEFVSFPFVAAKMHRPDGFENSAKFNGFVNPDNGIELRISRDNRPFDEVKHNYDTVALLDQGFHARERQDIDAFPDQAMLIKINRTVSGSQEIQWVFVRGDKSSTVIATAVFPDSETSRYSEFLKKIVMAVKSEKQTDEQDPDKD